MGWLKKVLTSPFFWGAVMFVGGILAQDSLDLVGRVKGGSTPPAGK